MVERVTSRLYTAQGPRIDRLAQGLSDRYKVPQICVDSIALDLGKRSITIFLRPLLENKVRNLSKVKPLVQSEVAVKIRK